MSSTPNITRELLFDQIKRKAQELISSEEIASLRTKNGNTQQSERTTINLMKRVFDDLGLTYQEAPSQQPYDFRNIGNIGLHIEIKKTDSTTVFFNDTCPSEEVYYIIFQTGKEPRNRTTPITPPQMIFLNGSSFTKESPWIEEFQQKLKELVDTYGRGENAANLSGIMRVYPRPTYSANISSFIITNNQEPNLIPLQGITLEMIQDMRGTQLKNLCREIGIPISGNLNTLKTRLRDLLPIPSNLAAEQPIHSEDVTLAMTLAAEEHIHS